MSETPKRIRIMRMTLGSISSQLTGLGVKARFNTRLIGSYCAEAVARVRDIDVAIIADTTNDANDIHAALRSIMPHARVESLSNYSSSDVSGSRAVDLHYVITSHEELAVETAWRQTMERGLQIANARHNVRRRASSTAIRPPVVHCHVCAR